MPAPRFSPLLPIVLAGAMAGCGLMLDTTGFSQAAAPADAGTDRPRDDASPGDASAPDATPPTCGPGPGGRTVRVGAGSQSFCIDATEVSNEEYARFLQALDDGAPAPPVPEACAFNASYEPVAGWPPPAERRAHPVVYVDQCDAHAYCRWAGKRLCGRIGGGGSTPSELANAGASQWFAACSAGGTRRFPYGATYEATRCNGPDAQAGTTQPVGAAAGCVGGVAGLYDMSGNVLEWEDSCAANGGATDPCSVRGGSFRRRAFFELNGSSQACEVPVNLERGAAADDVGFRCCSP